jgi:ribosome biogenesis GTPase
MNLEDLGWDAAWAKQFETHLRDGLCPARVICEHREAYDIIGKTGELRAEISGRFRHDHPARADWPAVGDWVGVTDRPNEDAAIIHATAPRRSRFSRKAPGEKTEEQIVAANVDVVFLVNGLDDDFNVRRIERYLTLAWDSGARPVIVLNKADIHPDAEQCLTEVESIAFGTPILTVSAKTGHGLEEIHDYLTQGKTGAFLGSSGVGKSSIVNALLGESRQVTQAVRDDDSRGRHTTTSRELIPLPGGGMVIDTPGMRELQLWTDQEGLGNAFADVENFAAQCRFADCSHENEPGCAIRAAIESGALNQDRFRAYRKLQREVRYTTLRQRQSARVIEKNRWKKIAKEIRRLEKEGGKM